MSNPLELEHVIGYTGSYVHSLVVHPRNKELILFPIGAVLVISDVKDTHNQEFLRRHDEAITTLSVSTSGKYIATAQKGSTKKKGNIATIVVWDFERKKIIHEIEGHVNKVLSLCFTHDDKFLCSTGESGLCIWDMETGKLSGGHKLDSSAFFVECAQRDRDFNPKRPKYTLVIASESQVKVCLWAFDVHTMQYGLNSNTIALPGRIAGFTRTYYGACLDDSGVFCFAGTKTGEMIVFNIQSAIFKHSFQVSSNGVLSICTSGDAVYVGSGDGKVKKLRGNDVKWETEKEVQLAGKITSLSLSSDSQTLYAGTDSGSIYTISASDLRSTLLEESHVRSVVMVGFDEDDSEVFCTASQDGTIRLWDLTDYSIVTLVSAASEATCAIYRNKKIISGWADGFVRCFDAKSEKLDWKINNAHRGGVTCIASNSQYICTGGNDSTIRLWNWRQEYVAQFNDHTKPVTSILIDCNQPNLIHSASLDKTVQTYDLKQNKRIKYHSVSDKNSLGFNWISQRKDSENEIISAGVDGKLLMWDIDYPDYQGMLLDPNKSQLKCCSVSPSGRYLATSGDDQLIKVWDLKTNKVIGQGVCHSMDVLGVQWSPDERQLVSVGADCAICVWNFYI